MATHDFPADVPLANHIADATNAHAASSIGANGVVEKDGSGNVTITGIATFGNGSLIDGSGNLRMIGSILGPADGGAFGGTDIVGGNDAERPVGFRASTLTLNVNGATTVRPIPQTHIHATDAPTVNDDTTLGLRAGDFWIRQSTSKIYVCVTNTDGAADWQILN